MFFIREALRAARAAPRAVAPKTVVVVASVLVIAVTVGACGSSGGPSASGSGSKAGSGASSSGLHGKAVTIVSVANSNPWAAVYNSTITNYLRSRGAVVHLLASNDPAAQVQLLNSAVSQHPDLIFLEALDSKAVAPGIAKAKAARM